MSEAQTAKVRAAEEDTQHGRYLTFNLGTESFGIEIKYITEIIGMQPITALPGLPAYIRGIINLRGEIIPVMDIRLRFGKEEIAYNDRTCIIVAKFEDVDIGLIVDSVSEVLTIPDEILYLRRKSTVQQQVYQGIAMSGTKSSFA